MSTVHYTIVIPASQAAAANTAAHKVDPTGGDNFKVGLSVDGKGSATKLWAGWSMTAAEKAQLETEFAAAGVTATWYTTTQTPAAAVLVTESVKTIDTKA